MTALCPWCEAPRHDGPQCPKCGAVYAKAEALKAGLAVPADEPDAAPAPLSSSSSPSPSWQGEREAARLEYRLRLFAIPAALLLALIFHASSLGHFLQRTFLSMMVHEVGHAATAWLCGFAALPSLWKTLIAEQRGPITPILVALALGYLIFRARQSRLSSLTILGALLLAAQLIGTLGLKARGAHALITFGGDGGAMVLGTALMATFFFGRETQLSRGQLRWGFLVIGAAAFVDTFATWWAGRSDYDAIPFGEIEGVGLSDPSKLTEVYGWSTRGMIHSYVALGIACLLGLAAVYGWGVRQARKSLPQ